MQTTLNINDNLFAQAIKIIASDDKNKIIDIVLREFIENHKTSEKSNILNLYGRGGIRDDYDYKALRNNEEN